MSKKVDGLRIDGKLMSAISESNLDSHIEGVEDPEVELMFEAAKKALKEGIKVIVLNYRPGILTQLMRYEGINPGTIIMPDPKVKEEPEPETAAVEKPPIKRAPAWGGTEVIPQGGFNNGGYG